MKRSSRFFLGLAIAQCLLVYAVGQSRFAAGQAPEAKAETAAAVAKLRQVIKRLEWPTLERVCDEIKASHASQQVRPVLEEALQSPDADIKLMGLWATAALPELNSLLLPKIVAFITDEDAVVRLCAVEALGRTGKIDDAVTEKAIPALIEYLQYEVGEKDIPHTEPRGIVRLAGDWDDFRRAAAEALGKIGPRAIPALMEALEQDNALIREGAARALGEVGPPAKPAVALLQAATKDRDSRVQFRAAVALWKVDQQVTPSLPILQAAVQDQNQDRTVQWVAIDTLGEMGPAAQAAIPTLIEAVRSGTLTPAVRPKAIATLGKIGPAAKAALPVLLEVLQGKDNSLEAALAIWRIDRQNKEIILVLIKLLQAEERFIRTQAAAALGEIGPEAINAVPALEKAATDEDAYVREAAIKALQQIAPKQKEKL